MAIGTNSDFGEAFAATLGWWRGAGVDAAFVDEPRSWLPAVTQPAESGAAPAKSHGRIASKALEEPPVVEVVTALPDDLDAFRSWWMTKPELDSGRLSGRVPPRGSIGAKLMIVGPMPESSDREHLFVGPEGKLLDLFIGATGLEMDAIYWASALPCHSPGADWAPDSHRIVTEALLRHVALVKPERLLVVGLNILPLLRHASAQAPAVSSVFNHEGAMVPLLAVRRIPTTASQPRWKSVLWQAWLDWAA